MTLILATASGAIRLVDLPVVYAVMIGFLVLLVGIGFAFRHFSHDASDYFRAGGQATWWLVGGSIFMGQFSAWTFTGAAGAAYDAGWSLVVQFCANVMGFVLQGWFTAAWFRQTREITSADLVRLRFGRGLERFTAGTGVFIGPLFAATQLYSLAIFVSAVFGMSISLVIVVLGIVVLVYIVLSGAWAVLAADFIQCLLVLPITIVMAVLSLRLVGGWDGLVSGIHRAGLDAAYAPVKASETLALLPAAARQFTWGFFASWYFNQFLTYTSLNYMAGRYLTAKDGREARRAAWFAGAMMLLGSFLWFVPPMVARLTISEQVGAIALQNPAEGVYALMAMRLLPPALVGVVLVAMCAATMSSLDSGLTSQAAQLTQNIYPALCEWFGWREVTGRARMNLGRAANFFCAVLVTFLALGMAKYGSGGVFKIMLDLIALLLAPLTVPLCLGLFFRRGTERAALVSMVAGWATSAAIRFGPGLLDHAPLRYDIQIFALAAAGAGAFFVTAWLTRGPAPEDIARTEEFFRRRNRPVDFAREIGAGSDGRQLTVVGAFGIALGAAIFLLLLPPSSAGHARSVVVVAMSTLGVGSALWVLGRRANLRGTESSPSKPDQR